MKHCLIQHTLTTEAATQLGVAALKRAQALSINISVCVVDPSGLPLAAFRMNQSPLVSPSIAEKKAYTAVAFKKPTQDWQTTLANKGNVLMALQSEPNFTYLGGGLPIKSGEHIIGAIGVSGGSEQQDIDCALTALSDLVT